MKFIESVNFKEAEFSAENVLIKPAKFTVHTYGSNPKQKGINWFDDELLKYIVYIK